MKLLFPPSGKRMIPYHPVGISVLASALANEGIEATAYDLEIVAWSANQELPLWPSKRELIDPYTLLHAPWDAELSAFALKLIALFDYQPGEPIGLSTMGYEQLLATFAILKLAIEAGSRVVLGGQFWSDATAAALLETLRSDLLTVTVGDGFEAVVQWHRNEMPIINSLSWANNAVICGPKKVAVTKPPIPHYADAPWKHYDAYARTCLASPTPTKRAHLYVWDKQCPYRCSFCRVSTGSNVKLSSPEDLAASMSSMLKEGISQFNFMTNELNPTLAYMRRFIKAMEPVLGSERDIAWFTYLRPDWMELSDLSDLRRLGCRLVRYGVETGSQRLSDLMKKDYQIDTIEKVLKNAAAVDIMNHANFLIGYPGESEDDISETLRFIERVAPYLHSARINPFYLPPGSPMAKDPLSNGIKLTERKSGYWDFELVEGTKASAAVVADRIKRVTDLLKSLGIGFSGVLPFETLDYLARHSTRDEGLAHMKIDRPYMWQSSSSDWLKSQLGGYEASAEWEATIYKRGRNYSLTLCND